MTKNQLKRYCNQRWPQYPWEDNPNEKLNISEDILNAVIPPVWASEIPGRAKNATLVKTALKPGAQPVRQSEFNTPILHVKKPHSSEYRLGFENGPTSFGKVPAKELEPWQIDHDAVTLLQYVDDLLIGSDS
ncbi:hypothetical protein QYF61_018310 [Mycteria americana]|uniref:Uncharacterized protein n=1 Tax=Mycteria americana TaxID=33587 RepID=A0AAN7MGP5_MYCAM|nr:hypothetical protein QYF61_018310 [Mycteria americana]